MGNIEIGVVTVSDITGKERCSVRFVEDQVGGFKGSSSLRKSSLWTHIDSVFTER